jgi:tol-pal system beta propeller repeat protein TolB
MEKTLAKLPIIIVAVTAACSCGGDGTATSPTEPTSPPSTPPSITLPSTLAGKVVFARVEGSTNVLMAMNPDATGMMSLGVQGFKPNVSPDGRKIAYMTSAENTAVLDLATGRETVVATSAIAPRWSPDGSKIVFWKLSNGPKDIWVMNADGSNPLQLTNGGGENLEADFSPDGSRIVFRRNTGDGGDLWIMNADGTAASLLYAGDRQDSDARWSPDGARIAFVRMVPSGSSGRTSEIFVINQDGSNLVRLTHDGENWSPTWSPDGSRIAFFAFRNGPDDSDLFTVRPDGIDLALLLGGSKSDHGPAYGPSQ